MAAKGIHLKPYILKALSGYENKPVVVPLVVHTMITQFPALVEEMKNILRLEETERYSRKHKLSIERVAKALELRVRMILPKMAQEGLTKRIDILKMRKEHTPDEFKKLIKEMDLFFPDADQLKTCQAAYQITSRGLGDIE